MTKRERHLLSDYVERRVEPSLLARGKRQMVPEEFRCPRCNIANPMPDSTSQVGTCVNCGLKWQAAGNILEIFE